MMNRFIYTTVVALAVAIVSTGCKHKPVGVTPIPGQGAAVGEGNVNTLPPGQPINSGPAGTSGIAENGQFNMDNWNPDRAALASDTIHFAFDSAVIRDNEKANIQQVAAALNGDASANLMIEGNCDERGTEEYNRSLGERRAEAAREALVSMGVDANRIHTISYGKDKPADNGHDEAAWGQNRRDEFVLLHPKGGA